MADVTNGSNAPQGKYLHLHGFTGMRIPGLQLPELGGGDVLPMQAQTALKTGNRFHTSGYVTKAVLNGKQCRIQVSVWFDDDASTSAQPLTATPKAPVSAPTPPPAPVQQPAPAVAQHAPTPTAGYLPEHDALAVMYPNVGSHNTRKTCMCNTCYGMRRSKWTADQRNGKMTPPVVQVAPAQTPEPTAAVPVADPMAAVKALIQSQQAQLSAMLNSLNA